MTEKEDAYHMERPKIAAVVVAFNRKQLLLECLEALKNQTYPLDAIFVIDGPSTDGTPEALLENKYINELPPEEHRENSWETRNSIFGREGHKIVVNYVRLYEDVGGSGGFHEGIKRACNECYNWIWIMDDDAKAEENSLEELVKYINLPDVVALASTVKNPYGDICKAHRGYISFNKIFPMMQVPLDEKLYSTIEPVAIDFASFVGLLIKSDAVKIIGLPRIDFFIYHDDVEYSLRLATCGCIYLVASSIVRHNDTAKTSDLIKRKALGRTSYRMPYHKLIKSYYAIRNLTYLGKKYSKQKSKFYLEIIHRWLLNIIGISLFDDNKFHRMQLVTSAYLDGLRGIFDNNKPKNIINMRKQ